MATSFFTQPLTPKRLLKLSGLLLVLFIGCALWTNRGVLLQLGTVRSVTDAGKLLAKAELPIGGFITSIVLACLLLPPLFGDGSVHERDEDDRSPNQGSKGADWNDYSYGVNPSTGLGTNAYGYDATGRAMGSE